MLFTDGPFVSAADLQVIDGEFNDVAVKNSLVVDSSPSSIISHATLSAGSFFTSRFQNFSGYLVGIGVNSNHVAAVLNILSTAINRPRALLHQIPVVEPDITRSSFVRWVRYYILHDFYRAVYHRRMDDRYEAKMKMYAEEKEAHWKTLKSNGFPIVLNPLACPGAIWEYGAGTWGNTNLSAVAGGSLASPQAYNVAITYCSVFGGGYQSYLFQNGAESAGSVIATITLQPNHTIGISITTLNPPNGQMQNAIGTSSGVFPPMPATHWNVYVGIGAGPMCLQNSNPIPIGTTTYTLPDVPVVNGSVLNPGQPAQYDFSSQNMLWRS